MVYFDNSFGERHWFLCNELDNREKKEKLGHLFKEAADYWTS
jgi:hypothetical protein